MVFSKNYAAYYDCLYRDKDYGAECDFLELLFKRSRLKPRTVLDLGCGTGGHALVLAKRGYAVVGVDRSRPMLAIARQKAQKQKVKVELINKDVTTLALRRKFDAVIAMFAVISYQTTDRLLARTFRSVREHLHSNGIFIFDCWHGKAVLAEKPEMRIKFARIGAGTKLVRFALPKLDAENHVVDVNYKLWIMKNGQLIEQASEHHRLRFLFPQEVKNLMTMAGFREVATYPFLNYDKRVSKKDWHLTVVGR